jgi:hypothetical protein
MEYGGVLPSDAPDPRIESEARVRRLPFPVIQLRPQPSLTRAPVAGFTQSTSAAALPGTRWPYDAAAGECGRPLSTRWVGSSTAGGEFVMNCTTVGLTADRMQ